jgi:hypothetical protein
MKRAFSRFSSSVREALITSTQRTIRARSNYEALECGRHAAARLFVVRCRNFGIVRSSKIGCDGLQGFQSE